MRKEEFYMLVLIPFLKKDIKFDSEALNNYVNDVEDSHIFFQDFISYNLSDNFKDIEAILIMDYIDEIYFNYLNKTKL